MKRTSKAIAVGTLAAVGVTLATGAGAATLASSKSDEYGAHLTDSEGRALYLFTADSQGGMNAEVNSTCYDDCAEAWPPLTAEGQVQTGENVDKALVGMLERKDGSQQVTYNGWPLYYFVRDQGDKVSGQDVHGFGGEWYLLAPDGKKLESES